MAKTGKGAGKSAGKGAGKSAKDARQEGKSTKRKAEEVAEEQALTVTKGFHLSVASNHRDTRVSLARARQS